MAVDKVKIFSKSTPVAVEQDVNDFLAQFQGQVCNVSLTVACDANSTGYNVMVHYKEKQKPEPEEELTEEDRISNGETLERALGL